MICTHPSLPLWAAIAVRIAAAPRSTTAGCAPGRSFSQASSASATCLVIASHVYSASHASSPPPNAAADIRPRALATVDRVVVHDDARVVDLLQQLRGPDPAAIVDGDQLHVARVVDVEHGLD